ncbi:MAG: V-type ATP synthase subunit A, partial [Clostridia bacterium]|nr:V-type ATP synthase subunit A [Clostridia bacterium]
MQGRIVKVSGPLIVAEGMADVKMYDVAYVGEKKLIGEVIELRGDRASIQVYEETSGLGVGDKVESAGYALSVELAPGLIEGIFDGIQRPLDKIVQKYGDRITRGMEITNVDHEKKWHFIPTKAVQTVVDKGTYYELSDLGGYLSGSHFVSGTIAALPGADATDEPEILVFAAISSESTLIFFVNIMSTFLLMTGIV